MLWKFVAKFCPNFVIALSLVTIRRSETLVRNRLNIPYDHVGHVRRLAYTAAYEDFFMQLICNQAIERGPCFLESHLSESPRS